MGKGLGIKGVVVVLLALAFLPPHAQAQLHDGTDMAFGKNRVQYRDFNWQELEAPHFSVFYYQGGRKIASRVVHLFDRCAHEVETLMDRSLNGPIQVIVYNDQSEFRQSNIGATGGSSRDNVGGTVQIVGSKVFLYATGNSEDLERDIKRGLAEILFNQTMFGGNWQDAVRNSSLLNFPDWYTDGLFSYFAEPQSAEANAFIVDAAHRGALQKIEIAQGVERQWLGHAVWSYVAAIYGEPVIANVLYMTRISKSIESGFRYAVGLNLAELLDETARYHGASNVLTSLSLPPVHTRANRRAAKRDGGDIPLPLRPSMRVIRAAFSPDGAHVVLATEDHGQIKIWAADGNREKWRCIARHGHKADRLENDIQTRFSWHPNGRICTYTLALEDKNYFVSIDLETGHSVKKELSRIDEIRDFAYSPDGSIIVFSGLRQGQSDLYRYNVLGNTNSPLWEDSFDDLQPAFSPDGRWLYFASNRPAATIPSGPMHKRVEQIAPFASACDIFRLDLQMVLEEDEVVLEQITDTPNTDDRFPQPHDNTYFSFIRTANDGMQSRQVAWRDSTVLAIDTAIHYRTFTAFSAPEALALSVLDYTYSTREQQLVYTHRWGGHLFWSLEQGSAEHYRLEGAQESTPLSISAEPEEAIRQGWDQLLEPDEVNFRAYSFGSRETPTQPPPEVESPGAYAYTGLSEAEANAIAARPKNYRLNYAITSLTTQLKNTFGGSFYQPYEGVMQAQPGLGGMTEFSAMDLFEDKRFTAGFRLAGSLENSSFGIGFSDYSRRWDRIITLERQGQRQVTSNGKTLVETHMHTLRPAWIYPFDEIRSLHLSASLRLDRNTPLATDAFNLVQPISFKPLGGIEIAFVHDSSWERTLNILEGFRGRAWMEYHVNPSSTDESGAQDAVGFGTMGFDLRKYWSVYRHIIFAVRATTDWSIGTYKLLHVMGGVDNVLSISDNTGTPVDPATQYAYQTRITPLRGFGTNARNGANMGLINAEIRVPIWSTLSQKPSQSDFLRHLQCIGFADVGSAWNGLHPYAQENTFNEVTVTQNPITVTIDNNHEPIAWGVGAGVRTRILGYWTRLDWSWGVDAGRWLPRRFTLSFNLDF